MNLNILHFSSSNNWIIDSIQDSVIIGNCKSK